MNVLHATKDLGNAIRRLRSLLTTTGHLFVAEQLRPSAFIDIVFGHCEGYWLFEDGIRHNHSLIDGDGWKRILQSAGYGEVAIVENVDLDVGIIIASNKEDPFFPFTLISNDRRDKFAEQLEIICNGYATRCWIDGLPIMKLNNKIVYCLPCGDEVGYQAGINTESEYQVKTMLENFLTFARSLMHMGPCNFFW